MTRTFDKPTLRAALIPASGWLEGRAIEEWIGKTPDAKIPGRVILRVFRRQGGHCPNTGARLIAGYYQVDHIKPLHAGGLHAESNLQLVTYKAHKLKTKAEAKERAKIESTAKKHIGAIRPKGKIQSRGFNQWADNTKRLEEL